MKKNRFILCLILLLVSVVIFVGCSDVNKKDDTGVTSPDNGVTSPDNGVTSPDNGVTPPDNTSVRYTVTEEEWDSWTTYTNYTIEEYTDSYRLVDKYTEYAAEFYNGDILIFDGDKEYQLKKEDDFYGIFIKFI